MIFTFGKLQLFCINHEVKLVVYQKIPLNLLFQAVIMLLQAVNLCGSVISSYRIQNVNLILKL